MQSKSLLAAAEHERHRRKGYQRYMEKGKKITTSAATTPTV